jgi:hypothetical protein
VYGARVLLDQFVARVNGNVILQSDINFEKALMQITAGDIAEEKNVIDQKVLLEKLIDRELLLAEARKFISKMVLEEEMTSRIEKLDVYFGGKARRIEFLQKNGFDEEFWIMHIRNQIILEKYIDQRFRVFVRVSGEEEDQYIRDHQAELNLSDFRDPVEAVPSEHKLRETIRLLLTEASVQKRVREQIANLRETADITYPARESENLLPDGMTKD